jgi:hypothetical protein
LHHEDILIIEAGLYANASIDVKAIWVFCGLSFYINFYLLTLYLLLILFSDNS